MTTVVSEYRQKHTKRAPYLPTIQEEPDFLPRTSSEENLVEHIEEDRQDLKKLSIENPKYIFEIPNGRNDKFMSMHYQDGNLHAKRYYTAKTKEEKGRTL